ncbi:MAG: pyridoxal phosphate-dependent aminotransferase [Candidatus Azambacteria bacterium]|nr:pyridoxal phosphate-dependent aminotransferase [Candidatus Azambacteria bacterium]
MRNNIVHSGAEELTYEIRGIVAVAETLASFGVKIFWENIGDPVAKGAKIPLWIKEIVKHEIDLDKSFGYCPTKGLLETREFLAARRNTNGGAHITPDDILFFNGLGDAISKVYTNLHRDARVIGPSPAYSTHSSAEAAHADSSYITYNLLPKHDWLPDLDDLKNKVKYNPAISGILIINPDNPTGMVYPKKVLEEIVAIAKEYDLFIISDEIYSNIVYETGKMTSIAEVIDGVPAIAMRGISKEFPWPGARCGWIEVYNKEKDAIFAKYVKSIVDSKMLEVCSTTLPQAVIPKIMADPRYGEHLKERRAHYGARAELAHAILKNVHGIIAPKPAGAFYMSVVFQDGALNEQQSLPITNEKARTFVEEKVRGFLPDKRFVYYLMAATGICVVPLSGFNSTLSGFRITLLESDEERFKTMFETVAEYIQKYLASA